MTNSKPDKHVKQCNTALTTYIYRYETEGVARSEEIERDKAKVAGRLAEAEDTITSLGEKIANLEKSKARAKAELDDLTAECERHLTNSTIIEKRGRNFDKVVNEWRLKAEDLQVLTNQMPEHHNPNNPS